MAKAAPDGYTVLVTTNTTHAANEHLYKKLPYDPVKDTAVYLPAGAPAAVTNKLNEIVVKISAAPALVAFQNATSGETVTSTPEGLAKFQAAESQKWGRIIRAAGIEPE